MVKRRVSTEDSVLLMSPQVMHGRPGPAVRSTGPPPNSHETAQRPLRSSGADERGRHSAAPPRRDRFLSLIHI